MIGDGDSNGEIKIRKTYRITGTGQLGGASGVPLLQVNGCIRVIDQYAIIKTVTTLVNATNIYATAEDGTVSEDLTTDGATISGFSVGSIFFKDKVSTEQYEVLNADQVRVSELLEEKKAGKPFTIVQKNGETTTLNLHLTTTDNPIDFTIEVTFIYEPLGTGSKLAFL